MLHLNRKKNEVIHLTHNESGETVDIVILEIKGRTVKLGFENPSKSHTILRKEVKQSQDKNTDPNPYYRDKKPTPLYQGYTDTRQGIKNIPMVDMVEAVDGLEQLVDSLIPTTEEAQQPTAA